MPSLPILRRRRERRIEQRQQHSARLARGLIGAGLAFSALFGLLIIASGLAYASLTANLPSLEAIPALLEPPSGSLLQPTRIYDRSGQHLLAVLAPLDAPRRYISISAIDDEHLPNRLAVATVALLDPGFWGHPGYSLAGLTDPAAHPTIPQKLIADLVLWDEAPGLRRALRERILAAQLVSQYGREQVLEWYLNSANYGRYAYGAEAAAQLYLGKPAAELNLAEAALLAVVNQSPAINPLDAPQAALQRQQEAIDLLETGGLVSAQEAELARFTPLNFQMAPATSNPAPAFVALALAQLETRFDRARVERGGMVVLTTLDYETQTRAACAVRTQLARLAESEPPTCEGAAALAPLPPGLLAREASASAAVIDPRTGQVLALVGDTKNGSESAFLTPHRAGTLLTPFIYLAGFTRGLSPATLTWDLPLPVPRSPAGTEAVAPETINDYRGPIRLRVALANDLLLPTRQVFDGMGAALVGQTLRAFGLDLNTASLAELLASENRYTVLDMARAYGIFAAQGTLVGDGQPGELAPLALLAMRGADGHDYADWSVPASEQVVSAPLAYLVTDVLRDGTVRSGPNLFEIGRPAAVKTGVTPDGLETWAAGYTPQRVVVVWLGGEPLATRPAAGLWTAVMQAASREAPADDWPLPPGMVRLNVCDPSGLLPTEACPNLVIETFIDGYQPVQPDSLYRAYAINRETGLLATVFTPPQLVENRVYLQIPPEAQAWAQAKGLAAPPDTYDTIRAPQVNPHANLSAPELFAQVKGTVAISGSADGDDFAGYRLQYGQGLNPSAWVLISESKTPVSAGALAAWDTRGLSGLYAVQLVVVRADQRLETATTQVTVDNDPPQIGLDFPKEGAEISLAEQSQLTFQPRVVDNLFVETVEIWLDGRRLQAFETEPFSLTWNARRGEHTLRILARDRLGNETRLEVNFTVQ